MALKQIQQMQETMKEDAVSNHNAILKLKEELKVKIKENPGFFNLTSRSDLKIKSRCQSPRSLQQLSG